MIKSYIVFFLLLSCLNYSQAPTVQWQDLAGGTYADDFKNAIQTSDGGYIAVGRSQSIDGDGIGNHGGSDLILVKYSSTGAILWKKLLGGSDSDNGETVRQTSDGGYIICGSTNSIDGDAFVTHTGGEYWIIKTNNSGAIEWQKSYGGSEYEDAHDIQQTIDGGYIVIGQSHSFNGDVIGHHANGDAWILKLDSTGNLQWQKSYGGSSDDLGFAIQQTPDGGYVFLAQTGSCNGDVIGLHDLYNCMGATTEYDFWVVKLNDLGNMSWQVCLGTNGSETPRPSPNTLSLTNDGGYIVCGAAYNALYSDCLVYKLSATGTIDWQHKYGGNSDEEATNVQQTPDGGYIIAGYTSTNNNGDVSGNHGGDDVWLIKVDSAGAILWKKCYGGNSSEQASSIQQTTDGGFIIAGYSYTSNNGDVTATNNGSMDGWIVKLSAPPLATDTFTTTDFQFYPNPAKTEMAIEICISEYEIFDSLGRKIKSEIGNISKIDISMLDSGSYIIRFKTAENKVTTQKFIKK